ncbi:MAG TPA: ArsB/NhaD family transporter [Micromonosporaceae bacterium]|jgi:Na+/H+ antiporter NhaD/arsenite permease-like protein
MSVHAWASIAVFVAAYVLIATEWVHRVKAAVGGALVLLLIGATDSAHAFFSPEAGIDWGVIFLLIGMMLIVGVLRRTGLFEYLAIWAAKRARGRPFRLMVMLAVSTALASTLLNNVTTVLLVAPVTFLVCERLGVTPVPFLLAEVMASNIGGVATLVGDPPNIIIASRGGLSFNDFVVHLAPLVVALMAVFIGLCRVMFRSALGYDDKRATAIMALRERDAIVDRRLLVVSLAILAVVLVGFVVPVVAPAVVAIAGGLVLLAVSGLDAAEVAKDVEWPTLLFFAGLFVMVGALVTTGVIDRMSRAATEAVGGHPFAATMVLLWASAALSAIVDNIPYVATMAPIVSELVHAGGDTPATHVLWWALALGAGLGGNATAIGASANVVMLGLAERAGRRISFWEFTGYGVVVTVVTVAVCVPYLWVRYFVLA